MNPERRATLTIVKAIGLASRGNPVVIRELGRLLDSLATQGWQDDELGRVRREIATGE